MPKSLQNLPCWDLKDLFHSVEDPRISQILKTAQKEALSFQKKYQGKLKILTSSALSQAYQQLETLLIPLHKVSQYIFLVYSTDTANDTVKALLHHIEEIESDINNLLIFFNLELSRLPQTKINKFIQASVLSNYAYALHLSKKTARYNLTHKEEKIINLKDLTGVQALCKLYEEITASFQFKFKVDGHLKTMNGSELRSLRYHRHPQTRRQAMKAFFKRYQENQILFTNSFNSILKDYSIEKKLRGYKSAISIRNTSNDLSDKSIAVLHDITTASYPLVHRYYKLKAKILNLPDMTLADIYAPMPQSDKHYSWSESKAIILDGFKNFDTDFYQMAKSMYDQKRLHAPVQKNKRGGAYCSSSTPDVKPYILLNYLGKERDIATIAHEIGHAIHDLLASKQTLFNYHPILPLAETASVFSEMLITDLLLKKETNKQNKIALLTSKLEDIFATSHRQNMFSRFEISAHQQIASSFMSAQDLCALYHQELKLMFGKSCRIISEYHWEWASIPHIFESPFYVYAYNFGNLLVMALYESYLEGGASFIPKYKEFLSMGSSAPPATITALVQADISKPKFWQKSLRYIESLLVQLENLCS
jgi:oligoendopeptidase F